MLTPTSVPFRVHNTPSSPARGGRSRAWRHTVLALLGLALMAAPVEAAQGVTGGRIQRGNTPEATPLRAGLKAEYFRDIGNGSLLEDLTNHTKFLNNEADIVEETGAFEARQDWDDQYGVRLSGWLVPPVTGRYVFYFCSDDQGALFLSTDANPAHKVQIASEPVWSGDREYIDGLNQETRGSPATNISASIRLVGGRSYFIEALAKEGGGGDNLSVTWLRPGGPAVTNGAAPIPGRYLRSTHLVPVSGTQRTKRGLATLRSDRISWRTSLNAGTNTFTAYRLDGPNLTGTYTSRGLSRTLRFSPDSITTLAAELAASLQSETVTNVVALLHRQSTTLIAGSTRATKKITSTLIWDVSLNGGATRRITQVFTGNGLPRRVLVLKDTTSTTEGAAPQMIASLRAAGQFPIDGGQYNEWENTSLLGIVDTVLWIQGDYESDELAGGVDTVLTSWLKAGGGLVRTEWSSYAHYNTRDNGDDELAINSLLPVGSISGDYERSDTNAWKRVRGQRLHPLAAGVASIFRYPAARYSYVTNVPGSTVVFRSSDAAGTPLVTAAPAGAGRIVHINSDLGGDNGLTNVVRNVRRLLLNAVKYTAP